MIKNLLIYVIFVLVFQLFSACKEKAIAFDGIVYQIEENKFGYEIYLQGKPFIKQENIPAIEGNHSFKDSLDALKTLDKVLERLNKGEKPSLTESDIQQLKIKI
ncbi:DUF4907 domain-containing protein [Flavobacterium sp. 9AF]|uniref:DUF4907 domain-containing protein n=1 Tax=Flavobacterium sp. 9AF TaxID=2653142 RepID=UPI001358A6E9|nr:DUF4907 domain-containing protein [Flavobacterium sp. 9AF]